MRNHMKRGIPTLHKGRRYRSRLEARWASFFDLAGWPYEYEPFELKGWIPDFLLLGATPVLVEIKPVYSFPAFLEEEIKGAGVDPDHEVLLLGCTIPVKPLDNFPTEDHLCLGWLAEREGDGFLWADAMLGRWKDGGGKLGFCHSMFSYADRISGGYDGGCYGEVPLQPHTVLSLWADAGNKTQWMAPK